MDREVEIIQSMADEFTHIKICMENARPYLFNSPYCYAEKLSDLRKQVLKIDRENVRINLDFGHLFLSSKNYKFNPVSEVEKAKELIAHSHIHDNFGNPSYYHEKLHNQLLPFGKGDCHMPVGWGIIPFEDILNALMDTYRGSFIMELRGRYFKNIREAKKNFEEIIDKFKFS